MYTSKEMVAENIIFFPDICTHLKNDYSSVEMVGDFMKLNVPPHFLNDFPIPQSIRTSVEPLSAEVVVI